MSQSEFPGLRGDQLRWMRVQLLGRGFPAGVIRDESLSCYLDLFPDRQEALEAWSAVASGKVYRRAA